MSPVIHFSGHGGAMLYTTCGTFRDSKTYTTIRPEQVTCGRCKRSAVFRSTDFAHNKAKEPKS